VVWPLVQHLWRTRLQGQWDSFFGSQGTIDYDGGGTYTVYDLDNKLLKTVGEDPMKKANLANSADPGLNDRHALNFVEAIRGNAKLNAPIEQGHCSTVLGNWATSPSAPGAACRLIRPTVIRSGDAEAVKLWRRDYEPGWEPTV